MFKYISILLILATCVPSFALTKHCNQNIYAGLSSKNWYNIALDYAKKNNVMVGDGRGSAGGSLVSYLLNITNINPIIA
jgi:hypothetical protein